MTGNVISTGFASGLAAITYQGPEALYGLFIYM